MSALYTRLKPDAAKEVTRRSHNTVESTLETWNGAIRTTLERDGSFTVAIGPKDAPVCIIATGNVNDGTREFTVPSTPFASLLNAS